MYPGGAIIGFHWLTVTTVSVTTVSVTAVSVTAVSACNGYLFKKAKRYNVNVQPTLCVGMRASLRRGNARSEGGKRPDVVFIPREVWL